METKQLQNILEALLFVAEEPISVNTLTAILEADGVTSAEVRSALQALTESVQQDGRGFLLREVAGGYQFISNPNFTSWVQKLVAPKTRSLSQASLETLAMIAYRQPIVRAEIEQLRGVDSGGVLKTLLEKGLVRIVGRREEPGQPLIYGTTVAFLELFDLKSLEELPSLKDLSSLQGDSIETQPGGNGSGYGDADEDEEEPTDLLGDDDDDDEDEETDVLPVGDFPEDEEALGNLEQSLKKLKALEKDLFPKEQKADGAETAAEEPVVEEEGSPSDQSEV